MKMNRLPAPKNKPKTNPIYERPKSLAGKSGQTPNLCVAKKRFVLQRQFDIKAKLRIESNTQYVIREIRYDRISSNNRFG